MPGIDPESERPAADASPPLASSPDDWSILIVDDNPAALATLRTLMLVLGLEPPLEAAGGVEAQELVRSNDLDCIITDLRMEPMSGLEFVRWLRHSNEAGNRTARILTVSAYRDAAEIEAACKDGANGFLAKPVSVASLRAALAALAEHPDAFVEVEQTSGRVRLKASPAAAR